MLDFFGEFEILAIELLEALVKRGASGAGFGGVKKRSLLRFNGEDLSAYFV